MKRILRFTFTCALLIPAAVFAAAFEGKIAMKLSTGTAQTHDLTYLMKGEKIRMEMQLQGTTGAVILEPAKSEAVMLMPAQKMAMVLAMPAAAAAGQKDGEAPKLEKTGETETILGRKAEKYIVTHQGTKADMWLAEGLGSFVSFNPGSAMGGGRGGPPAQESWERALAGKEMFPLRVVSYDKAGKETSRMEVTAIEKQTLAASLFEVPADYRRMDMSAMMKGMPGGFPTQR